MHVQPLAPWRSTLPWDIPSLGFAGQSITAACSVMLAGPALSAFAIFHSSECADVVNVPGANGVVAVARSSAPPVSEARFPRENRAVRQKAARQNAAESVSCRIIPYKMKQGINSRRTGNLLSRAGNCSVSQGIAHHGIDSAANEVKLRKLFSL